MNKKIRINFVGDISLFKVYENRGIDPFNNLILPPSDLNIGNFEFIIPNDREKYFFDVPPEYNISYEYFKRLNIQLFDAYSLSNNHCMDYGLNGANDVIQLFETNNINVFGFGKENFNIFETTISGVSIAIIGFVKKGRWSRQKKYDVGPDDYDVLEIVNKIKDLKKSFHHVIIFPHWGTELVDVPDPSDVANARKFIDVGATAVIGHHPHIIQGMENYKGKPIWYSLGSFIYVPEQELGFNSNQSKDRNYSICLNLELSIDEVESFTPNFYYNNKELLIPQPIENEFLKSYFSLLCEKIGDENFYKKRIRKLLLKREFLSFLERMKNNPFKTTVHYLKYIKLDHLKKLLK